jgi:hypothetical protein
MQLVRRIPNAEPDREVIEMQVRTFRQKVSEILAQLDSNTQEEDSSGEVSVAKLFEEIKLMFQDIPSRIAGRLDPYRKRRFRPFHPMIFEEGMRISLKRGDPIGLLIVFSYFRDEIPWLYELGLEVYKAVKSHNRVRIEKAIENISRAADIASHTPFMREIRDEETYFIIRELPLMISRRFLSEAAEGSSTDKDVDK